MSVRDIGEDGSDIIKHYKIRNLDSGGFYISPRVAFVDLTKLLQHYKGESQYSSQSFSVFVCVSGVLCVPLQMQENKRMDSAGSWDIPV